MLISREFVVVCENLEEAGEMIKTLLLENPGGRIIDIKKKFVETKYVDYYRLTLKLGFGSEKDFREQYADTI